MLKTGIQLQLLILLIFSIWGGNKQQAILKAQLQNLHS